MFLDEIYSYGLANSYFTPFLPDVKDGNMVDKVFLKQELKDYVTVTDETGFKYDSVYYNQTQDKHPPLYYFLLHTVCSIYKGHFTKWTGLCLNYMIHLITLLVLYKICAMLFCNRKYSITAVLLYGLSAGGLSTVLMIRMYALLTMLTVLQVYLVIKILKNNKVYLYLLYFLTVLAGLMTQYFYIFYSGFLCCAVVLYLFHAKQYRKSVGLLVCYITAIPCLYILNPACISQLFSTGPVSGEGILNDLSSAQNYIKSIEGMVSCMFYGLLIPMAVCVLFIVHVIRAPEQHKLRDAFSNTIATNVLIITIPALADIVAVMVIAPYKDLRYIENVLPVVVIGVVYLISELQKSNKTGNNVKSIRIQKIMVVSCIICGFLIHPKYIYLNNAQKYKSLLQYKELPCVYINNNEHYSVTSDLLQLINFDEFFLTDSVDSVVLRDYINNHIEDGQIIVYIDSNHDKYSITEGFLTSMNFQSYEELYSGDFSSAYLFKGYERSADY